MQVEHISSSTTAITRQMYTLAEWVSPEYKICKISCKTVHVVYIYILLLIAFYIPWPTLIFSLTNGNPIQIKNVLHFRWPKINPYVSPIFKIKK